MSSRASGGLGILDPYVQQSALQLRWLIPLLLYPPLPALPISFLAQEILAACTGIQDHHLPFFFPLLRTYSIKEPFSIFTLLFRAFSHLPSITD
ncbi:hypothetical protein BDF14DRAFT_1859823, partial [Spinellus fusiger]